MANLNESTLIETMRKSYYNRLLEVLDESDVRDKKGNVVIEPGLKVRHKKSQYEYTVDTVEENPSTGDVTITLRSPEMARFEPSTAGDVIAELDDESEGPVTPVDGGEDLGDEEIIVVDEKEFEKDYEVN